MTNKKNIEILTTSYISVAFYTEIIRNVVKQQ